MTTAADLLAGIDSAIRAVMGDSPGSLWFHRHAGGGMALSVQLINVNDARRIASALGLGKLQPGSGEGRSWLAAEAMLGTVRVTVSVHNLEN